MESHIAHDKLKPGQVWRHYKGKHYKILVLGKHSETDEVLAAYQRQEDGHVFFRPIDLFFDEVVWEGKTVPHFVLINAAIEEKSLFHFDKKFFNTALLAFAYVISIRVLYQVMTILDGMQPARDPVTAFGRIAVFVLALFCMAAIPFTFPRKSNTGIKIILAIIIVSIEFIIFRTAFSDFINNLLFLF